MIFRFYNFNYEQSYLRVREKIEQSGRDARWEFSRKLLFEKTIYMSERCGDLFQIATVLGHFQNILGQEFRGIADLLPP